MRRNMVFNKMCIFSSVYECGMRKTVGTEAGRHNRKNPSGAAGV